MVRPGSWIRPAGASPARVGTGAPGSRPQSGGESLRAERGVKSLFGGSKRAGRSGHASPAASTHLQRGSRAAHVTAKATSAEPCSGASPAGPPGVGGAARAHGLIRNRRDPSFPPTSGNDRPYKPMVKSGGGKRESDGAVVAPYPVGAKGPDFGHAGRGGTRQGMAGHQIRPNHPGGPRPAETGS